MTERASARSVPRCTCSHSADLHGARAGRGPGACHHPDCGCPAWTPVTPTQAAPDPRTDRDLYLAFDAAVVKVVEGDPSAGYELVMTEVTRWYHRVALERGRTGR